MKKCFTVLLGLVLNSAGLLASSGAGAKVGRVFQERFGDNFAVAVIGSNNSDRKQLIADHLSLLGFRNEQVFHFDEVRATELSKEMCARSRGDTKLSPQGDWDIEFYELSPEAQVIRAGIVACGYAHHIALGKMFEHWKSERKFGHVLVLESNAAFGFRAPGGRSILSGIPEYLGDALKDLPAEYGMLYLMHQCWWEDVPVRYRDSNFIFKRDYPLFAKAILINLDGVGEALVGEFQNIFDHSKREILPADHIYAHFGRDFEGCSAYVLARSVVFRSKSKSKVCADRVGQEENYFAPDIPDPNE